MREDTARKDIVGDDEYVNPQLRKMPLNRGILRAGGGRLFYYYPFLQIGIADL